MIHIIITNGKITKNHATSVWSLTHSQLRNQVHRRMKIDSTIRVVILILFAAAVIILKTDKIKYKSAGLQIFFKLGINNCLFYIIWKEKKNSKEI